MANESSTKKILNCEYEVANRKLGTKRCIIQNADFSLQTQNEKFSFTGSEEDKAQTTGIEFKNCQNTVDYLPEEIISEFPKLVELVIRSSNIPVLRNTFFTDAFKKLEYIDLENNKIKTVEDRVFDKLVIAKYINLGKNEIETISSPIFSNNLELRNIFLNNNKIKSVIPDLFKNLNQLQILDFESNECASFQIDGIFSEFSHEKLNEELSKCFKN
jgi:Leucine-rich repeat (LRR) protein